MRSLTPGNLSNAARFAIAALVASFIVLIPLENHTASANVITPNDGVCNLSSPISNNFSISTAVELWEITDCVDQGQYTFNLVNDINLSSIPAPLNNSTSPVPFSGVLNGGGNAITQISISSTATSSMGLFANAHNAEFRNLTISGVIATTSPAVSASASVVYVGALAGVATGAISVSSVTSNVEILLNAYTPVSANRTYMESASVGGLFGVMNLGAASAEFSNVRVSASITSSRLAGGIAGKITTTGNSATFNANSVSILSPSIVSFAPGGLTYRSQSAGFVGNVSSTLSIVVTNSENRAYVDGVGGTGGFFGQLGTSSIKLAIQDSANYGKIYGNAGAAGGIAGRAVCQVFVERVGNHGQVTSILDDVGGLFGAVSGNATAATISNSINTTSVGGRSNVGGLFGVAYGSVSVYDSPNSGDVAGTSVGNSVGGLGGQIRSIGIISGSINSGQVAGGKEVGGIVGRIQGGGLYLTETRNVASVSASVGYTGGLVGFASVSVIATRVLNSGHVQAPDYVGGFVGFFMNQPGYLLQAKDSANTGTISANSNAAGFVGLGSYPHQITNSLQVGNVVISNPGGQVDAISLGDPGPSLSSVFTNFEPSAWVSSSSDIELRSASTFADWDLDDVWGFLDCNTYNGFPVLRFAHPGATFTSTGCVVANQGGGGQGGGSGTATPAPIYVGPTVVAPLASVTPGSSLTLTGTKLDIITKATIGELAVTISSQTQTTMVILIPSNLGVGVYDLVVDSPSGRLTIMAAIMVSGASTVNPSTQDSELIGWRWVARFDGNQRTLNANQAQGILAALARFDDATTVICWAYTSSLTPNDWAIAHATARAKAACDLIAANTNQIKTAVRVRYGVEKSFAIRAALQFWK